MPTYIVFHPQLEALGSTDEDAPLGTRQQRFAMNRDANRVLVDAVRPNRLRGEDIYSIEGLGLRRSVLQFAGGLGDDPELLQSRPRSLDALSAVLIDDLSTNEIEHILELGCQVVENFDVDLVEPSDHDSGTNDGSHGSDWHLESLEVRGVHNMGFTGFGVTIGILDSGVDWNHIEFEGKKLAFMEFDSAGEPVHSAPHDKGDHGTHVCALAAGKSVGVAPQADLAVALVLSDRVGKRGTFAQILAGLNWLLQTEFEESPVSIINASFGSRPFTDYWLPSMESARYIDGVLVVAAVGNNGKDGKGHHASPANYGSVLAVGACDQGGKVAEFSDWGFVYQMNVQKPDLCAPGVNIRSAIPDGQYAVKSGTSMAAPLVSGVAALLISQDPSLDNNPEELSKRLLSMCDEVTDKNTGGNGRLSLKSFL